MRSKLESLMETQWYAVTLLFLSTHSSGPSLRPLCEERVVLYREKSEDIIRAKAIQHGIAEGHSYKNVYGERVSWRFIEIAKIELLDPPADGEGWEVASRFVRRSARLIRTKVARLSKRDVRTKQRTAT